MAQDAVNRALKPLTRSQNAKQRKNEQTDNPQAQNSAVGRNLKGMEMDEKQAAAYIYAQSVGALARIEAMKAANRHRQMQGYSDAYGEDEFDAVPEQFGIHQNQVLELFASSVSYNIKQF